MTIERMKSKDIEDAVYSYLLACEKYELMDASKVTFKTGLKTYNSVIKALLKLEINGKLKDVIAFKRLGGRKVMVRL